MPKPDKWSSLDLFGVDRSINHHESVLGTRLILASQCYYFFEWYQNRTTAKLGELKNNCFKLRFLNLTKI